MLLPISFDTSPATPAPVQCRQPLPRSEMEAQPGKALLQSAFGKLDLVSRDEFDSQMVVLARTCARLSSRKVAGRAACQAEPAPPNKPAACDRE